MKKTLTLTPLFILLLSLPPAARAQDAQRSQDSPPPLRQLTLTFELADLPGRDAAGSFWEVSYQWRIADQGEFNRWSDEGEDPARQSGVGALLSKQSFRRRNLSAPESRRFSVVVPVSGELSERLRNAGRRPQTVWLDASVRIHDGKLGTDVVKRVNPAWGPYFYRDGVARVRVELTREGYVRWSTSDVPPWSRGKQHILSKPAITRP